MSPRGVHIKGLDVLLTRVSIALGAVPKAGRSRCLDVGHPTSQSGDVMTSKPMPRSLHVPKRVTRSSPNRCPDHYMFPSG